MMDLYDFGYGYGYEYRPWGNSEKSCHAKRREKEATDKFDSLMHKMQTAVVENTMAELRGPRSHSSLKSVPTVLMNNIFGYVFGKDYKSSKAEKEDATAEGGNKVASTKGQRARKAVNYSELNVDQFGNDTSKVSKVEAESGIDFSDMSLYEPGNKITIPLTKPNHHLTQPCFRDLRKHVKKNHGWDVQRIATSEQEKKEFKPKITRKGPCYYINVIYKVPGNLKKKRASGPAKKEKAKIDGDVKPAAKRKPNPVATAALQKAVNSALNDPDGEVDIKCLKRALDFGFSKFFVTAEAAKQNEDGDSKPAAKKKSKK